MKQTTALPQADGFGEARELAASCALCAQRYPVEELRRCNCGVFMCHGCYDASGRCVGEQCDAGARSE